MSNEPNGISIGIVFFNEANQSFSRLLNSLLETYQHHLLSSNIPVEFIFVDNQSTIRNDTLLIQFCEAHNLTYKFHRNNENNMGSARNKALVFSKYEVIIFLDADCYPKRQWLTNYVDKLKSLEEPDWAALGGENIPPTSSTNILHKCQLLLKKIPLLYLNSPQMLPARGLTRVLNISTCNALYKTNILRSLGGFNEGCVRVGEDLDLSARLIARNWMIFFAQGLEVEHHDKTDFLRWFLKIIRYGSAQPRLLFSSTYSVSKLRWIPLFLLFAAGISIYHFPDQTLYFGLVCMLIVPLLSCAYHKDWPILIPWFLFLNGTVFSYLLGYVLGIGKSILQLPRQKNASTIVEIE